MPLYKKILCPFPHDAKRQCYYCKGTGLVDIAVYLKNYEGEFNLISSDLDVEFPFESTVLICPCGDKLYLAENDYSIVCSCGRIYRAILRIEVDETYIGKQNQLIELSNDDEENT